MKKSDGKNIAREDSTQGGDSDNGGRCTPPPRPACGTVVLDVGGTRFRCAKSTLMTNSTYMESLLSGRWRSSHEDDSVEADGSIFIDQDPKAFAILLAYMRTGFVQLPRHDPSLCEHALMQAQFLGVDGFLVKVKATASKRIARKNDFGVGEVAEAMSFDERYGPLEAIIARDILPGCYFPPSENMEIRVHDRVFHASKQMLVDNSTYFKKVLTADPVCYWKESHSLCFNPDVVEVALQWICSHGPAFTNIVEKVSKVPDTDRSRHLSKIFTQDILNCSRRLGTMTEEEYNTFMNKLDEVISDDGS